MIKCLAGLVLATAISTTNSPALWQADYGKALAATRSDDRPLLVVMDVADDPEQSAMPEQLAKDKEQSELLDSYQLCHVDVSTDYGKKVAEVFHATSFPHTAIIDKTGSVILCRKTGQLSDDQWQETLAKYQDGDRTGQTHRTSYYRGESLDGGTGIVNPGYCPSCQRKGS